MDMFIVPESPPLRGRVAVGGAKNAALPIMAAALVAEGPTLLHAVPHLVDVETLSELLQTLGMEVIRRDDDSLFLQVRDDQPHLAEYEIVRRMRAGICVLGPLLARRGRACVSLPGGCAIGDRPIDLHLKGLAALGADLRVERGYIIAQASRLRGARIHLGGPLGSTVTGTCNVMTAATLAEGTTVIEAAACEPEVVDLGNFLNRMGAGISGLGTDTLRIEGVRALHGTRHTVIPDRVEAATLMLATAMTHGDVTLENVQLAHMTAILEKLTELGVGISSQAAGVRVTAPNDLRAVECIMRPFPGLPTDVQAQFMALLTTVPGVSKITDTVFPDRFMHLAELIRLGASLRREGATATIRGVEYLSGACVMASDLRASAALVIAGLAARKQTLIRRIYHLDRGYDGLEHKLNHLGAQISRLPDLPENIPDSLRVTTTGSVAAPHVAPRETELRGPNWRRNGIPQHAPPADEPA